MFLQIVNIYLYKNNITQKLIRDDPCDRVDSPSCSKTSSWKGKSSRNKSVVEFTSNNSQTNMFVPVLQEDHK